MNWCYLPPGAGQPGEPGTLVMSTGERHDQTLCAAFQRMGLPLDPYRDLWLHSAMLGGARRAIAAIRQAHRAAIATERLQLDAGRPPAPWQADALDRLLADDPLEAEMTELDALFELAESDGGRILMSGD